MLYASTLCSNTVGFDHCAHVFWLLVSLLLLMSLLLLTSLLLLVPLCICLLLLGSLLFLMFLMFARLPFVVDVSSVARLPAVTQLQLPDYWETALCKIFPKRISQ